MNMPLEQETIFSDPSVAEFNKKQNNPMNLPNGFHEVLSAEGRKMGFGFYCEICKLHFPGNAPKEVRHCGKVSRLPEGLFEWMKFFFNVKTVKIARRWY